MNIVERVDITGKYFLSRHYRHLTDYVMSGDNGYESGVVDRPSTPTATQLIIYGLSKEAIKETKSKLEGRLEKETKTIIWDVDSCDEAPYISRLSDDQVPAKELITNLVISSLAPGHLYQ